MSFRIYQCDTCGDVLGVGQNFPDDGTASHVIKKGDPETHEGATLFETPNTPPPGEGPAAVLEWAAAEIDGGQAIEVIP